MIFPYLHRFAPTLKPATESLRSLAAALRRDVEVLATDIGPRGTHAPERYALAAAFLESALGKAGYRVNRRGFDAMGVACCNLEAELPGERADRVLVVGAHYDTVEGCPGANDNGSGVAGVLAAARALSGERPGCTVRFVLFANEEPPFFNMNDMGSQIYTRECRRKGEDIRGMVCLETIGYYAAEPGSQKWPVAGLEYVLPTVGDFICFVGPASARGLIHDATKAFDAEEAFALLAAAAPNAIDQVNWSDHRGFNEAGYEGFMVTDTAPLRYPHYHLASDTAEKLDYESMARVVQGVIGMIRRLATVR